jgi:arsenate reductase-like glutaredoxin family protein
VIVAKGKKVREFSPGKRADDEIVDAMLGPTGNLRAPTIRRGKTVLVGFEEDAYAAALL